ncbi:MAG: STAS domain-containing protein [Terriglobales bacterium]
MTTAFRSQAQASFCRTKGSYPWLVLDRQPQAIGVVVLKITGDITLGRSSQELEWEVNKLVEAGSVKVVFDFTNVNRMDSCGIGIVALASGKLREAGGELRGAGANAFVTNVLHLTRLDSLVMLTPTVDEALTGL